MTAAQRAAKRFRREHRCTKPTPNMDRAQDAFKRHAGDDDTLRHFGTVVQTGHVISTRRIPGQKIQDLGMQGPRTLERIQHACRVRQGEAFERLPGRPPEDSVAGMLEDGALVPVKGVEMVWNDRQTINAIHGRGIYEQIVAGSVEEQVLELAKKLYAKQENVQMSHIILSENDKDWGNPAFARIYAALAMADRQEPGDEIVNWLNANGFCNLTCCPQCRVDDFVHVEGCAIANALDQATAAIEKAFTANPYTPTPGDPTQPLRPKVSR